MQFLNKTCEIPLNNKTAIVRIPCIIKSADKRIQHAFLRGLADTDFSVSFKNKTKLGYTYPVIKGSFKSKPLIQDLENLYADLGFVHCVIYNEKSYDKRKAIYEFRNSIYLNGKKNLEHWVEDIGFSNPKFQAKVQQWQEAGVCPPVKQEASDAI